MMRIDPATDADIPWILQQLESFASWTGGKHKLFPADPAMAEAIVRNVVRSHVMLVAWQEAADNTRDFERLGLIAGYVTVHPFNPALRLLAEAWRWVAPEHRGSSAGLRLLEAFVDLGKKKADLITFALEAESPVNDRVLTRRGFKKRETGYLLEV